MMLIAHRGNLFGPKEQFENDPDYLIQAIKTGCMVEADVRGKDGWLYFGHDEMQYEMPEDYFEVYGAMTIFHAKNLEAMDILMDLKAHWFFHDTDDYTITSYGYVWAYPGMPVTNSVRYIVVNKDAIAVPDKSDKIAGICSDYAGLFPGVSVVAQKEALCQIQRATKAV